MSWQPLPGPEGRPPRRVGEALEGVASSLGLPAPGVLSAVFEHWDEVVGERVAGHARPLSLHGDRLVVAVEESAWATQLRYLEADVLRRLAEVVGEGSVRHLEVRVRPS